METEISLRWLFSDGSLLFRFENAFEELDTTDPQCRIGDSSSGYGFPMVCSPSRPHLQKIPIVLLLGNQNILLIA